MRTADPRESYDAVVVLGGGLQADGRVPPWVANRLERAIALAGGRTPVLTLSAGTTHKPPPLDDCGRPVFESVACAHYLKERGFPGERLLTETASYDTVGNAYFARTIHCDPAGWRRLAVVTSAFHMARSEAIFRWIFAAEPSLPPYALSFHEVPDVGMETEVLDARRARETASLASIESLSVRCRTLAAVHAWLFREHAAYAFGRTATPLDGSAVASY